MAFMLDFPDSGFIESALIIDSRQFHDFMVAADVPGSGFGFSTPISSNNFF
jgi:hypothetical protein